MKSYAHCVTSSLKIVHVMLYLDIEINSSTKEMRHGNYFFHDNCAM